MDLPIFVVCNVQFTNDFIKQVVIAVMLKTGMWEVSISDLSWVSGYAESDFLWFCQAVQDSTLQQPMSASFQTLFLLAIHNCPILYHKTTAAQMA
jgi:hypothetical protein